MDIQRERLRAGTHFPLFAISKTCFFAFTSCIGAPCPPIIAGIKVPGPYQRTGSRIKISPMNMLVLASEEGFQYQAVMAVTPQRGWRSTRKHSSSQSQRKRAA
jgi:hypothetical protein